ncbi:bifunctional YncE family protein/alkaline phosphatase family protein [Mucilaginibacter gilvus]|uniref:Phosphoesterase n=1 Tax=Mucilaginibacter gilvus TaxID=2305909 RepID=A0A444MR20_9SPHI|nr:bifunctional YncE family protein/alkaline phosphatase family protein [Mucilaginibacter gilvus]RWY54053.1 phosphoesterase [Mucilaginibacter gilvus]
MCLKTSLSVSSLIIICAMLTGCQSALDKRSTAENDVLNMHHPYDDSTLTNKLLPVMMPYNRLVASAGKVVSFGDPELENHSLDVKLIPGTTLLAIEDRYGIAIIDTITKKLTSRWAYNNNSKYRGLMSTYSGLKVARINGRINIFWSAALANGKNSRSLVLRASWDGEKLSIISSIEFTPQIPAPLALPNEIAITNENGKDYLYVVLNGNNQLVKTDLTNNKTVYAAPTGVAPYGLVIVKDKAYVTNWAGPVPADTVNKETAGVPFGQTYIDPKTGATLMGTVSVINPVNGATIKQIPVGLHPNAIIASTDGQFVYVANGNSDELSVISTGTLQNIQSIAVKLMPGKKSFVGDTPNALAINAAGTTLYVANGMDNAVAVIKLGNKAALKGSGASEVKGFIPTEAYPGGLAIDGNNLFVTNLEGEGARVGSGELSQDDRPGNDVVESFNSHHQKATLSIIGIPDDSTLKDYTKRVKELNLTFRQELALLLPRKNVAPKPMPERIGEPSVFNHVLYIIKENRTYDQVLGDMPEGNGNRSLCIYGDSITPNQHSLARKYMLLDNYYASGKCSAEGHQWTDAAMVTDYVEKNVRAWFRSYPHVQEDALVYGSNGFIWNNAADHGKTVRIYGEACQPRMDNALTWSTIFNDYQAGRPLKFVNTSTISRVRPMLSQNFPGSDEHRITEQVRASAFIKELKAYEAQPGDALPQLMVMALSADHTVGTRPGLPTPNAMVADNDLAVGRIVEAVTKSRFWKNTVIFITEDDSQAGWDHVSAYRTTGFVISPYSVFQHKVSTNYNQVSMVRSIEQILGIPPMNILDASALPMFNCFNQRHNTTPYQSLANRVAIDRINPGIAKLKGAELHYAKLSLRPEYDHIDGGNDDVMNRILWFAAKGKKAYPANLAGKDADD